MDFSQVLEAISDQQTMLFMWTNRCGFSDLAEVLWAGGKLHHGAWI